MKKEILVGNFINFSRVLRGRVFSKTPVLSRIPSRGMGRDTEPYQHCILGSPYASSHLHINLSVLPPWISIRIHVFLAIKAREKRKSRTSLAITSWCIHPHQDEDAMMAITLCYVFNFKNLLSFVSWHAFKVFTCFVLVGKDAMDESLRIVYCVLRAFRILRLLVFYQLMESIVRYYPRKRKIFSSIVSMSKIVLVMHILGIIWLVVLCEPGYSIFIVQYFIKNKARGHWAIEKLVRLKYDLSTRSKYLVLLEFAHVTPYRKQINNKSVIHINNVP